MAEQQVNDWRTMAPGPELDRLIAEKTGWRVERIHVENEWAGGVPSYRVFAPDGTAQLAGERHPDNSWYEYELQRVLPASSRDLNAAIALLDTLPDDWAWAIHRRGYLPRLYIVEINDPAYRPENFDSVNAETLDELPYEICRLWLAWKEKNP